jgi:hypothetical protein
MQPEDRERVIAWREARARREAAEALKGLVDCEKAPATLLSLTDAERELARARADLLLWVARCQRETGASRAVAVRKAIYFAEENAGTCGFSRLLAAGQRGGNGITIFNVERWMSRWRPFRRHALDDYQWWVLAPRHTEGATKRALTPATRGGNDRYWFRIALLYEQLNGLELVEAWKEACRLGRENGWGEEPSYRQVQYWYQRHADRAALTAKRLGEKFVYNALDVTARRDWTGVGIDDAWFSDHHEFNVFVRVPAPWAPGYWIARRPWITQILSCPSMHEVASVIRAREPDGDVILEAWRAAVDEMGWAAAEITFDNGKDYRSVGGKSKKPKLGPLDEKRCATTAQILGVRARFALPFNARAKPCEMDFGIVERKFERRWETYCGHNWERFKILHPTLKREKLATFEGESNPLRGCLVNPDLVPTLEEFTAEYYRWRAEEREQMASDGILLNGQTPAQAWAEGLAKVKQPVIDPETRFVAFLRAFGRPQKVDRGGIVWFKRGESKRDWIRYQSDRLLPWLMSGEEVLVKVDVKDVSQAYVFEWADNHGWRLIDCGGEHGGCLAVADIPANTGMDEVRDLQRDNRARRKKVREALPAQEQEEALLDMRRRTGRTDTEVVLADPPRMFTKPKSELDEARKTRSLAFEQIGERVSAEDLADF